LSVETRRAEGLPVSIEIAKVDVEIQAT
jgi:hypothetical protein